MTFRLLGHWPTSKKFQNDHWYIEIQHFNFFNSFLYTCHKFFSDKILIISCDNFFVFKFSNVNFFYNAHCVDCRKGNDSVRG